MGVRVMIFWGGFSLIRNLDKYLYLRYLGKVYIDNNLSYQVDSNVTYVSDAESASEESVN